MTENAPLSSSDQGPSHKGLTTLVIGLGVLIFVGLTVLIGTITWRVSEFTEANTPVGTFDLALPAGAQIQSSSVNDDQLLVHVVFPADPTRQELLVINHITGEVVSRVEVTSGP